VLVSLAEPRTTTIEGRTVLVVERTPPLQANLDGLLRSMFAVTRREDIRPTGAAAQCERANLHRWAVLREGRHYGLDRTLRDISVEMCRDCGSVMVRDVSFDRLPGLRVGASGARRRNVILGWYTGQRAAGRTYHGPRP
jgi:hypothetical protein